MKHNFGKRFPMTRRMFLGSTTLTLGAITTTGFLHFSRHERSYAQPDNVLGVSITWNNVAIGGGGSTPGILVHPTANMRYIRTDVGGMYRWESDPPRWVPLLDWIPKSAFNLYGVESFAIDPNDASGNTVYAALGKYVADWAPPQYGTVMKSTDGGRNWQDTDISGKVGPASNWNHIYGERLTVDPNNSNNVYYASSDNGLWRSGNAATNWEQVTAAPQGDLTGKGQWGGSRGLTFVLFDKNSGLAGSTTRVCYLGAYNDGVYRSSDGGASWHKLAGSPSQPARASIDGNGTFYVCHATGLAKFANDTWTDITPPQAAGREFCTLAIDPFDSSHLITCDHFGGFNNPIYRSTDGGQNWSLLQEQHQSNVPWWNRKGYWAASIFNIAFDPHQRNRVYYTDWFGTWFTDNITASPSIWTTHEQGHEELVTFVIKSSPSGVSLLSGMADVGGFRHESLTEFPQSSFENPILGDITGLDFSESDPNFVVHCGGRRWDNQGGAGYSKDNGVSWSPFATLPTAEAKNGRIAVSATGQRVVYIPMGAIPYVTSNLGQSWQASSGAPVGTVRGDQLWTWNAPLASDRVDGNLFYLYHGQAGAMYRSIDGGLTWAVSASNLPVSDWQKVEARPDVAGHVWVSLGTHGLWYSTDGGLQFSSVPNVQAADMHSFGKPAAGNTTPALYLYGRVNDVDGIFLSDDLGTNWTQIDTPQQRVGNEPNCMAGDRQTYGRVYIGTNGRGILYTTVTQSSNALPAGTYTIMAKHSGKVLGVAEGSSADEALIHQQENTGSVHQHWQIEPLGNDIYKVIASHSGKALDVQYGGTADGTLIWQWPWNNSCAQHWKISQSADGAYTMQSACSDKVIDIEEGSWEHGARAILWSRHDGDNQKFYFSLV